MLPPPHSLHWLLMRLCWQMPSPPQSLHWFLIRLCWQMPAPPHSLHLLLCRLCSHCPDFPPRARFSRARFSAPLSPPSSPSGAARLLLPSPESPLCSFPALLPHEPPECPDRPPCTLPRFLPPYYPCRCSQSEPLLRQST